MFIISKEILGPVDTPEGGETSVSFFSATDLDQEAVSYSLQPNHFYFETKVFVHSRIMKLQR